jgi:hypothetical protein
LHASPVTVTSLPEFPPPHAPVESVASPAPWATVPLPVVQRQPYGDIQILPFKRGQYRRR